MSAVNPFNISRRFIRVWERNFAVYRKTWKISFLPPIFEPLLYIVAFGLGLSSLVGKIPYQGSQVSYVSFIAPALIAVNIMYNAFFENTFGSFVRMYYQKTFHAMMATPLSLEEIITGEIVWGATKSAIATIIMMVVLSVFGLIRYPHGLLIIPMAFLGGFAFGAVAMFFTGIVPTIDMFNLPTFLFITPMFLFSDTFFPVSSLPMWAQRLSFLLPLTHIVVPVRLFSFGILEGGLWWNFLYLVAFSLIFFRLALAKMHHRLIK
jgi:lipooligosaccharide transport system permease protein